MPTLEAEMHLLISVLIAALALYGIEHYGLLMRVKADTLSSAAGVVAQISATLAGFLLAVLSVLATIVNTRLVRNMQKTGHYQLLLRRLFANAAVFVVSMVAGMVAVFSGESGYPVRVLIFFSIVGLVMLVDAARKFWMVLSHLGPASE